MSLKIVLVSPLIPQNTGSIARLTAATNCQLHLIEPLGFELSDRYLKRAGLDYWPYVNLTVHTNWNDFLVAEPKANEHSWFFTTKSRYCYLNVQYTENDYLVFGSETKGLPETLHQRYENRRLLIPIDNPKVRSINLANAVSIALYEARRQCHCF